LKYIGDIVLTTPLIHTLRDAYPGAYIAYLGESKGVSLLEHNPYLNEIFPIDFARKAWAQQLRLFAQLYRKRFDLVVDLFCNPRSALLSYATRAPVRVGGDLRGRGRLYTIRLKDDGTPKSAIDFHYQSLKAVGIQPKYYDTEIFLTDDEKKEARRYLQWQGVDFGRPVVAIHAGATWDNKMWLKESFAKLMDLISAKLGAEILLSPGPDDQDLMKYLKEKTFGRVHVLPVLPVRQLAGVLSQCKVFVSNDCGPMHIGVAVGTKTIGIFGPEPVDIWFPYDRGKGHVPMFKKIFCSPCRTTTCFRTGDEYLECMKLLSVGEVYDAVKERL
jgi:ADP-heptose:LPS heptosyltransferase